MNSQERTHQDTVLDTDPITCQAVALHVANIAYKAALESAETAKSLGNMCDALPEILPKVVDIVRLDPDFADALGGLLADRLWAYAAIEHARIEAGDGYGYIFGFLAERLSEGADPKTVRTDALAAPARIRDTQAAGGAR